MALAAVLAAVLAGCSGSGRPAGGPAPRGGIAPTTAPAFRVLVFTRTAGFRHASIPVGVAAIRRLGAEHGFAVDDTADAGRIGGGGLAGYRVVVFLSTTGDLLDGAQRAALQRYVRGGGGWVGVHAAADAEYGWPWYGELVGAFFRRHPAVQRAVVHVAPDATDAAGPLPARWERSDEWYDFRSNPRGRVRVLATVDESTYSGGTMGHDHPIAWCRGLQGRNGRQGAPLGRGRSWYTAMGHTSESFQEPLFLAHLLAGIRYAAGVSGARC